MNLKISFASGHLQARNALDFSYNATLERLSNRREMENYSGDIVRISKATYAYVANSSTFSFFSSFFCFVFVCGRGGPRGMLNSSNTIFYFISCLNYGHQDFLELAVEDFNNLQCIHRKELKELER